MRNIKDKNSQPELKEINPVLQNLLQVLANNIYFTRMLLLARTLLFGQSNQNGQKLLKYYIQSDYFISSILSPSELLKDTIEIKNDFPLIKEFRNSESRDECIRRQYCVENYYKKLPNEKQLKFRDIFSESICLSIINELSKIEDIDVIKILFLSSLKQHGSENSRKFIRDFRQFKTKIINSFIKEEKLKNTMLMASDTLWDHELEINWRAKVYKVGYSGFFEPKLILIFSVLCVFMVFLIKEFKIYRNPVFLLFFILLGFTLPIYFIDNPGDVRVGSFCGSSTEKMLADELASKEIFLNEKLMLLLKVAEEVVKPKKTIFIYKLADQPQQLAIPQSSGSPSAVNFFTSFFFGRLSSKQGNLQQFYVEDKKKFGYKEKIYQALIEKGYQLDDEKNAYSPKLVEYHRRLVIFSFDKVSLEKTSAGLDEKVIQVLEKSIRNPNPQRFGSTSEKLNRQPILIKGWLDGKQLRIMALHEKTIDLGSELGNIQEFCFTTVMNQHGQTQFYKASRACRQLAPGASSRGLSAGSS